MVVDGPVLVCGAVLASILVVAGKDGWFAAVLALSLVGSVVAYYVLERIPRPAGQPPPRSPLLGWLLKGVSLVALVYIVFFFDVPALDGLPEGLTPLLLSISAAMITLAMYPMYLGYKLCARTIVQLRPGACPPVVFLRAFNDDERTSLQPDGWVARFHGVTAPFPLFEGNGWTRRVTQSVLWPYHPIRVLKLFFNADRYYSEELFARVFRRVGPLVAIGRPGEPLPTAGADRMYVSHEEWQQFVLNFLAQCQVVILQPSKSEGVRWEVEQVLLKVPLAKVLLCLSNFKGKPEDYEEFRTWVRQRTSVELPAEVPALPTPSLVYFEADGTPKVQPVCYLSPLLWPFLVTGVDERRTFGSFMRRLEGKPMGSPAKPRQYFGQKLLSVLLTFALFIGLVFGFFIVTVTSEQSKVEQVVRDGIKTKTGHVPDRLTFRRQGGGKYLGTAWIGSEEWDITATVERDQIRWESKERITTAVVERTAREVIRNQTGHEAQKLALTQQPDGKYKGTAIVNGVVQQVTVTVAGQNIACKWGPAE